MKRIASITIKHILDESPDISFLGKYTDTLEPGVIVRDLENFYEKLPAPMERAEIQTSENEGKNGLINRISSGGLWGIESDSDESYFKEVAQEELAQLEKLLLELGFTAEEIKSAFEKAETKGF